MSRSSPFGMSPNEMVKEALERQIDQRRRARMAQEQRDIEQAHYHRQLAFDVWAMDFIRQERRPYLLLGVVLALLLTIMPWFGLRWLFAPYGVEVPFHWVHFLVTGIMGMGLIHFFAFTVFNSRYQLVRAHIVDVGQRLGLDAE